jgi:hypothetical protein
MALNFVSGIGHWRPVVYTVLLVLAAIILLYLGACFVMARLFPQETK